MNQYQQKSCTNILIELSHIPCYAMFYQAQGSYLSKGINLPIYFKLIEEKLERGMYQDVGEFTYEVRAIFRNAAIAENTNIYRKSSAKLLSAEFERMINDGYILQTEQDQDIFSVSCALNEIMHQIRIPLPNLPRKMSMPGAAIFHEKPSQVPTAEQLQSIMNIINDPYLAIQVITYASFIQSECTLFQKNVSIDFNEMNEETRLKVYDFIMKLLRNVCLDDGI